jgi:DNA-binding NarL/FixJ family response regulator
MTPKNVAIVIAPLDRFRESIQILLTSISRIDEVFTADSITQALSFTAIIAPSIVILDSGNAKDDLPTALKLISETWQGTRCIVLVNDRNELPQENLHGADLVMQKGFNASQFIIKIEEIFSQ